MSARGAMPRLLVGLGNPAEAYVRTRHNIGRRFIDQVAESTQSRFTTLRQAETIRLPVFFGVEIDPPLVCARLTSFMNNSGPALRSALEKLAVVPAETLIIVDDFMIPFGSLRLRTKGTSGGHNGLKSIFEALGTDEVPRLRIGIGPTPVGEDPADYVLKRFSKLEEARLPDLFRTVEESIAFLLREGYEKAMTATNKIHF